MSVSGFGSDNYVVTYVDGTLTVGKATVTVTANDATKVYGSGVPALSASYSGFVNGDNVSSLDSVASLSTLANATSNVGSYAINPVGVSDDNYSVVTIPGTLTVTPASLTVTPNNASKVYGSVNPAFSATYIGFVNGETASVLRGSLTLTTTATNSSKVGSYVISGAGLLSANYDITVGTGILAVTPAALTVKANDSTRSYGAANPTFSATYSGFVNNDTAVTGTPTFTTTATAASNVGTFPITVSGVTSPNYTVSYVDGLLTVKQVTAKGTVANSTKIYGAALPAFSVNYTGLINGDTAAMLPAPTYTTTATAASKVGTYAVSAVGASAGNYLVTYSPGTLTITKADLAISVGAATKGYGEANPTFAPIYAGFVNGDTVTNLATPAVTFTSATAG